jgi:hypothetical protein
LAITGLSTHWHEKWLKRLAFDSSSAPAGSEGSEAVISPTRVGQCNMNVSGTQPRIDEFFAAGPIRIIAYLSAIPTRQQNQFLFGKLCKSSPNERPCDWYNRGS